MKLSDWAVTETKAPRMSDMSDWVGWIDTKSPLYRKWLAQHRRVAARGEG